MRWCKSKGDRDSLYVILLILDQIAGLGLVADGAKESRQQSSPADGETKMSRKSEKQLKSGLRHSELAHLEN